MRVIVALGGNALLRRGEPMHPARQAANVVTACRALAPLAREHELVITHGNGPQVGLLALHDGGPDGFPLDVLDAETEGMIGYLIERELGNIIRPQHELATVLTMIEVDPADPAFEHPTKPIGPWYAQEQAAQLIDQSGWTLRPDGDRWRRVVASPEPVRIIQLAAIRRLLESGCTVVCAGGGGIPVVRRSGALDGIAAVIDKDRASSLLARELDADLLVIATEVDGVYLDWDRPGRRRIDRAAPATLLGQSFAEGSMRPKIEAACAFAAATGKRAVIGALDDLELLVRGEAGTVIAPESSLRAAGFELT